MIDVNNIINYNRTDAELEELILFLIAVAGKKADRTAKQIDQFLEFYKTKHTLSTPFNVIKNRLNMGNRGNVLIESLRTFGFGCYTRLARAFTEIANSGINLRTCTLEDLMKIHGIGRKSASCFLAWTREGVRVAMLDTHILKFLRVQQASFLQVKDWEWNKQGKKIAQKFKKVVIPFSTPSNKVYDKLEEIYLDICDYKGLNPTKLDLEIWRSYANH